jgi:hypothetical protein
MLFFFVVIIIVLNLIFGVIIDTFADLRTEKQQKEKILKNTCFTCGLDRSQFDNKAVSFEDHIRHKHNMWHYLYFIVLVRVKDPTEFTGPESYVYAMVKVSFQFFKEVSFFVFNFLIFKNRTRTWNGSHDCGPSRWQQRVKSRNKTKCVHFKFSLKQLNLLCPLYLANWPN